MIRFVEITTVPRRRYLFADSEKGLSGECVKVPGKPWTAMIVGVGSASALTREEACRRVMRIAETAGG